MSFQNPKSAILKAPSTFSLGSLQHPRMNEYKIYVIKLLDYYDKQMHGIILRHKCSNKSIKINSVKKVDHEMNNFLP